MPNEAMTLYDELVLDLKDEIVQLVADAYVSEFESPFKRVDKGDLIIFLYDEAFWDYFMTDGSSCLTPPIPSPVNRDTVLEAIKGVISENFGAVMELVDSLADG